MKIPRMALAGIVAALLVATPIRAAADVFISEICDPRLNYLTDRFIEIYNPGPSSVNLTGWKVTAVGNGSDIFTWNLSGSIAADEALVVGDLNTVISFQVDFPQDAWSTSNSTWNGKVGDGAKLINGSAVVTDIVVATGVLFENMDLVRDPSVLGPNPVFTPGEWAATPVDFPTQGTPGTHTTVATVTGPTITSIVTNPATPAAGQAVHVQADITDVEPITGTVVHWGLAPATLTNTITMSVLAGDTYQTVSTIPAQAPGTIVYYEVEASNSLPATTTSDELSFEVPITLSIATIQGAAASSPYDGQTVTTSGVVTAVYDSAYVIQDGAGAWNGLWAYGAVVPAVGDSVTVQGLVSESDGDYSGNTLLTDAVVQSSASAVVNPAASVVTTTTAATEAYEGVLVLMASAVCTDASVGAGEWLADDGSGVSRVGVRVYDANPILGTTYDIRGPVGYTNGQFKVEPRDAADVVWVADNSAPVISNAEALNDAEVRVVFSEAVEFVSATNVANYTIPTLTVTAAVLEPGFTDRVLLSVSTMATDDYVLTAIGVVDLYANATAGTVAPFSYYDPGIPAGYYATTSGLYGTALKTELHDIIDGHSAQSYSFVWTAFYTTDPRPDNGKVWDIYSDIPGGVPPYLYTFGTDQGGTGGIEGTGYNREHSWPSSWFGAASPMYTDIFMLYPTDNHVNGMRGSYPYGETDAPTATSLNGSKVGPCSVTGYAGTIFEPIDEYKGDLARTYFYFSARYEGQDGGWAGSPNATGAELTPWTIDMLLDWHSEDPVSLKEINRNTAIYGFQGNRNPYIDHPEFAERVYGSAPVSVPTARPGVQVALYQNTPNPFYSTTRIAFDLQRSAHVQVQVFDVRGAMVRVLSDGALSAGRHELRWDGRNESGASQAAGVYFYRLKTGATTLTRKLVLAQ